MSKLFERIVFWLEAARLHTIPTSFMSWLFPFIFGLSDGGSLIRGLLALAGIVSVHLGVNLFDDVLDYYREEKKANGAPITSFDKAKGKCWYLLEGKTTLLKTFVVTMGLFGFASLIGIYLLIVCGWPVCAIAAITAVLCLFYPFSTKFGLGETTVGIVYAPLLCLGTYFVMTGKFSIEVLLISISTGLLTVGLLHTSTMLDYDFDIDAKKITICTIVGNKHNAVLAQIIIILLAYLNIIAAVIFHKTTPIMLITLLTIPTAYNLIRVLNVHMEAPEQKIERTFWMGPLENWNKIVKKNLDTYMIKFLLARNVMFIFTTLVCIAKIISEAIKAF